MQKILKLQLINFINRHKNVSMHGSSVLLKAADQSFLYCSEINQPYGFQRVTSNIFKEQQEIFKGQSITQLGYSRLCELIISKEKKVPQGRNQKSRLKSQTINVLRQKSKSIQVDYSKIRHYTNSLKKVLSSQPLEMEKMALHQNMQILFKEKNQIKDSKQVRSQFHLYDNLVKLKRKHKPYPKIQRSLNMENSMIKVEKIKEYIAKKVNMKTEIANDEQVYINVKRNRQANILTRQQHNKLLTKGKPIKPNQFIMINKQKNQKAHNHVYINEKTNTHKSSLRKTGIKVDRIIPDAKRQIQIMRWQTDMEYELYGIEQRQREKECEFQNQKIDQKKGEN